MSATSKHWDKIARGETAVCYLAVGEYFASHGRRMGIILHDGNLPWGDHVIVGGVKAFSGSLEGGPYVLRMASGSTPEERTLIGTGDSGDVGIVFEGDCQLAKSRWGAAG